MNTEQRDELLFDYLEGNLGPDEALRIENLCLEDPDWAKALAEWQKAYVPEEALERPAFLDKLVKKEPRKLRWVFGFAAATAACLALLLMPQSSEPELSIPATASPQIAQRDTAGKADSVFLFDLSGIYPLAWNSSFFNHWTPTCGGVIYSHSYPYWGSFPFPSATTDTPVVELVFEQPSVTPNADTTTAASQSRVAQLVSRSKQAIRNKTHRILQRRRGLNMAQHDLRAWLKGEDKPRLRLIARKAEESPIPQLALQFHSASIDIERTFTKSHE
jgi:hypothetical protein